MDDETKALIREVLAEAKAARRTAARAARLHREHIELLRLLTERQDQDEWWREGTAPPWEPEP